MKYTGVVVLCHNMHSSHGLGFFSALILCYQSQPLAINVCNDCFPVMVDFKFSQQNTNVCECFLPHKNPLYGGYHKLATEITCFVKMFVIMLQDLENYSYVYNHPFRGLPCSLLVKVCRACIVLHNLKTK